MVFLGFYSGFGGLSCFLVVFLVFFCGFELLTTKTTVKTKQNHEDSILRDSLKMVFFGGFSWFLQWFWWFVVVIGGFS